MEENNEMLNMHLVAKRKFNTDRPVFVKRYIILDGEVRCGAIRLFNASDAILTGVSYSITQTDKKGEFIARSSLEFKGFHVLPGNEFSVPDVELDKNCRSLEIEIEKFYSGDYEYVLGENELTVNYKPDMSHRYGQYKKPYSCAVTDKSRKTSRLIILLTMAALVLSLIIIGMTGIWNRYSTQIKDFLNLDDRVQVIRYVEKY